MEAIQIFGRGVIRAVNDPQVFAASTLHCGLNDATASFGNELRWFYNRALAAATGEFVPPLDGLVSLSGFVTSTSLYGVFSNRRDSKAQSRASVSMCHVWACAEYTFPSLARIWNGASFRSSSDSTGQQ